MKLFRTMCCYHILKRSRYGKGHFRPCPGYCCFVIFCLNMLCLSKIWCFKPICLVFYILGLKVQKTTKNHRFLEKINIFYIVMSKYKLQAPYVHIKQLRSYFNIILIFAKYSCLFLGKNINFSHFFTDFWK